MAASDLVRLVCETYHRQRAMAGETVPHPLMTLVRSPQRPSMWDANHASGIKARTADEIEEIFRACDQLLPAAVAHRKFFCDPLTPPPFVARLVLEGYDVDPTLQLVLEDDLRAEPKPLDIRLAESDPDWQSVERLTREDHVEEARRAGRAPYDASVTTFMVDARRAMQPEVRMWIGRAEGEDCGYFASWPGFEGLGMVEWLFTSPRFRRRGFATALIARAVADARARGAGPVLIGALGEGERVPARLYASLGFRPVCVTHGYAKRWPRAE